MPDQVTFKVLQWTMQVSGKFKTLSCEWTLWASIAQCHKAKKTKWKTKNYMKYYHSKKTRATFSLALRPYIVAKSQAWWSEKCHVMIFCLSMKAEKGNIGRYYFFPGNFSSLWAILFSFPLKQSSLCLAIEKEVDWNYEYVMQGAKKIIFTACHSGKLLKLAFTSPDIISTSPKNFLTGRSDFTVLLLFELLKKHHLPIRQVINRINKPDSKIH